MIKLINEANELSQSELTAGYVYNYVQAALSRAQMYSQEIRKLVDKKSSELDNEANDFYMSIDDEDFETKNNTTLGKLTQDLGNVTDKLNEVNDILADCVDELHKF